MIGLNSRTLVQEQKLAVKYHKIYFAKEIKKHLKRVEILRKCFNWFSHHWTSIRMDFFHLLFIPFLHLSTAKDYEEYSRDDVD